MATVMLPDVQDNPTYVNGEMEWYPPSEQEMSIVAEILESVDDNQLEHQHVELSISDVFSEANSLINIKMELDDKDTLSMLHIYNEDENTFVNGNDEMDPDCGGLFIRRKKCRKVLNRGFMPFHADDESISNSTRNNKEFVKHSFQQRRVGRRRYGAQKLAKKNAILKLDKTTEDCVYPVQIAARKVLNRHHFDRFYVDVEENKHLKTDKNNKLEEKIKHEVASPGNTDEEGFVEMCEFDDEAGCSSVELEYGSGISIYESVEACESDNDTKGRRTSASSVFRCTKCLEEFPTKNKLQEHKMAIHKKNTSFKCEQCSSVYKRPYKYHCHVGGHDGRFSCKQCHRTFVRVTGFRKHLRQCHKLANPNICVVCGEYFTSHEKLDAHLVNIHPAEAEGLRAYFRQCLHCRYQFITELTYLNHIKNAPYKCNECDMAFECNNKLGFHLNFKHKPQVCGYCGKGFDAFDQYTYHVRYYHMDKNIKCPYCEERFRVRSRLLIHIDVNHTEGHNYKCNQCDYTAKNYASVNRHRRIAHMPKNETHKNVCDVCGKSFLVLSRLKVHMKSHSDAKPHVCHMCGRGYKFEYLLKRHQKNPELCLRVLFPNGTRLERKGKRRCDMCNLGFPSPDQLALHMVEVHDVKIETKSTSPSDNLCKQSDDPQTKSTIEIGEDDKIYDEDLVKQEENKSLKCSPLEIMESEIKIPEEDVVEYTATRQHQFSTHRNHSANAPRIPKVKYPDPASASVTVTKTVGQGDHTLAGHVHSEGVHILAIPYQEKGGAVFSDDGTSIPLVAIRANGEFVNISTAEVVGSEQNQWPEQ